ncbi:MAG: transposase [Acidobacteriota bacterium]|nr:transposase [Acidobacteriota bacterium]
MPRIARLVIPGIPHHVIQRGNRRQQVFFSDEDKLVYLKILKDQGKKKGLRFWAYCLMDNHVHLIAVPGFRDSLSRAMSETHRRYTNLINIRENWKGYLWQGRFLSFPLGDAHLLAAARYIERNPVRAGLVQKPEDYVWSSAGSHVRKIKDDVISDDDPFGALEDWADFLQQDEMNDADVFRRHTRTGRPLGDDAFIRRLEEVTGRILFVRKPGRKPVK